MVKKGKQRHDGSVTTLDSMLLIGNLVIFNNIFLYVIHFSEKIETTNILVQCMDCLNMCFSELRMQPSEIYELIFEPTILHCEV